MYPWTHFLFPFFLGEVFVQLQLINHPSALFAGLLGIFIDIDHLIEFIIHHKSFNLRHVWHNAVVKHEPCERTVVHHTTGFIAITLLTLALIFAEKDGLAIIISLGYYTHLLLDYNWNFIGKPKSIIKKNFVVRMPLFEIILDTVLFISTIALLVL